MLLLFLVTFFLLLYAVLIIFYWYHWLQLDTFQSLQAPDTTISVIIAARNEEKTLPRLLQALQQQTLAAHLFEVIIVDDHSADRTKSVIEPYLSERIRCIQPAASPEHSSKKKAIDTGVRSARHELIVITDADCLVPPDWLATISAYQQRTQALFIAAPVRFAIQYNLLEILQGMDFMVLQGITAASVSARFHTMANGANLGYTKQAFLEANGFEGIDQVASGDDMLFMQKIWKQNRKAVHYLKSEQAIVTTEPMHSWRDFINQRRRWASKSTYYKDTVLKVVLLFVYLFNLLFFVLLAAALIQPAHWPLMFYYLLGKVVIELPFFVSMTRFYREQKLIPFFILLQPVHIAYTVLVGFISQFGKYEWKSRRTK